MKILKGKKAQLSIEYIVTTGFMLTAAAIIFGLALFFFNENTAISQAETAVSTVVNHANLAASLGEGSKVFFTVDFPKNAQSFELAGRTVNIRMSTGGINDVFAYSKVDLNAAAFSASNGRRVFSAEYNDGNVVVTEHG